MGPVTNSHLMPVVLRPDPVMVRGQGSWLWDSTGRRYLDFLQGWAVNALGHCAPEVVCWCSDFTGPLAARTRKDLATFQPRWNCWMPLRWGRSRPGDPESDPEGPKPGRRPESESTVPD